MNRCLPPHPTARPLTAALSVLAAVLLALGLAAPASAQFAQAQEAAAVPQLVIQRPFPPKALRGKLSFGAPPEVLLDGQPNRLSPGSRIRDTQNMQVLSGSLVGQSLMVNYTVDNLGQVHEVWILTAEEIAQKRPTAAESNQGRATMHAWGSGDPHSKDDGKTPFDQLPRYPGLQ